MGAGGSRVRAPEVGHASHGVDTPRAPGLVHHRNDSDRRFAGGIRCGSVLDPHVLIMNVADDSDRGVVHTRGVTSVTPGAGVAATGGDSVVGPSVRRVRTGADQQSARTPGRVGPAGLAVHEAEVDDRLERLAPDRLDHPLVLIEPRVQGDPQAVHSGAGAIERRTARRELEQVDVDPAPFLFVLAPPHEQFGERGIRGEMQHAVNVDPAHHRRQRVRPRCGSGRPRSADLLRSVVSMIDQRRFRLVDC